ncbi:hypothetical protein VO64_1820 [Pseudomonas synxantha]|uniref:Uncharacterized protein n=2 Tax=Pseudomonas synxantha TaxID=47883 RepID=A0AAU8TJG9_9PSED|nr:hypothetical protein VO64_1820 [Pseudomonas synxantha]
MVPIAVHEPVQANELSLRHPGGWELVLPRTVEPAWLAHLLREMR